MTQIETLLLGWGIEPKKDSTGGGVDADLFNLVNQIPVIRVKKKQ